MTRSFLIEIQRHAPIPETERVALFGESPKLVLHLEHPKSQLWVTAAELSLFEANPESLLGKLPEDVYSFRLLSRETMVMGFTTFDFVMKESDVFPQRVILRGNDVEARIEPAATDWIRETFCEFTGCTSKIWVARAKTFAILKPGDVIRRIAADGSFTEETVPAAA